MKYYHVDVFAEKPMTGNGLTVVYPPENIDQMTMLKITQEFKQFETIFVFPESNGSCPVRIFTVEEELEFAGHPAIGAAAVVHYLNYSAGESSEIRLAAGGRIIELKSESGLNCFRVRMNQGRAEFIRKPETADLSGILASLNLSCADLYPDFSAEVVSTGLPYLLLPIAGDLGRVKIIASDLEDQLGRFDAKFVYIFNPETLECRTWDNSGLVEDVATGSAAGPLCACMVKNGYRDADEDIAISQGRFTGRPSIITGWVSGETGEVFIRGDVVLFSHGEIFMSGEEV